MEFLPGAIALEEADLDLEIWRILETTLSSQDGYCAYKLPLLGMPTVEEIPSFVIITPSLGVVLIDIFPEKITEISEEFDYWITESDEFYSRDFILEHYRDELISRFKRSHELFNRRESKLFCPIKTFIVCRQNTENDLTAIKLESFSGATFLSIENYEERITELAQGSDWSGNDGQLDAILSLVEGTETFGVSQRSSRRKIELETMDDYIQSSLNRTFRQDSAQRKISMQIPPGPQRIRGLAGTGKTVVLCLKAALTSLKRKDYKILYLFNTQSMYNMIERHIGEYCAKEAKSVYDPDAIDILHAWGGRISIASGS